MFVFFATMNYALWFFLLDFVNGAGVDEKVDNGIGRVSRFGTLNILRTKWNNARKILSMECVQFHRSLYTYHHPGKNFHGSISVIFTKSSLNVQKFPPKNEVKCMENVQKVFQELFRKTKALREYVNLFELWIFLFVWKEYPRYSSNNPRLPLLLSGR